MPLAVLVTIRVLDKNLRVGLSRCFQRVSWGGAVCE
jgi:hypothetical protein